MASLRYNEASGNVAMTVITVTNSNNDGQGSLREAIAAAGPGDTIDFAAGVTSVSLTSPLTIIRNVDIEGDFA